MSVLTSVCAWCGRILAVGLTEKVTHGICEDCQREVLTRGKPRLVASGSPR